MSSILTEQINELMADSDLDPIRRARALAQLAASEHWVLGVYIDTLTASPNPDRAEQAQAIRQCGAQVQQVLAQEIETLRANADVDPIRKARTLARLARVSLRLADVHHRLGAEALRGFDLVAALEEAHKEAQPEIERRKRYWFEKSEEALAETSADAPNWPSGDPSPGGTVSAGS
jgi:hypothetical protein